MSNRLSAATRRPRVAAGLLFLTLLCSACGTERAKPPGTAAAAKPNVLIVMLDSCRADKISAYGFERPTTPRLDALAADPDAALFLWHYAQAPHTKASTASLFSGTYPFQHGVIAEDLLDELELKKSRYKNRVVADSYQTLAESFAAAGYRTYADPTIGHLAADQGFAQGVTHFMAPDKVTTDAQHLARTLDFLSESSEPTFAYLHLRACHNPFTTGMRNADYLERFAPGFDETALKARGIELGSTKLKLAIRAGRIKLLPAEFAFVQTVYEAVLRRVDELLVGTLVDELERRGLYDRTLLVVSADHGEELYEHGSYAHGHAVWNVVSHVPMIVKFPRGARPAGLPARVEQVTQAIDLFPGLLLQAGIEPPEGLSGRDPFVVDERPRFAYSQAPGSWTLVQFPFKVMVFEASKQAQLFDLSRDPGETNDIAPSHPDDLRRLVRLGEGLQKALPRKSGSDTFHEGEMSQETIDQLRSLGYIQ